MNKYCNGCKKELSVTFFGKDKHRSDGLTSRCKKCRNLAGIEYRKTHPEFIKYINDKNKQKRKEYYKTPEKIELLRKNHLKRKFGITQEVYDQMFKEQNGVCVICKQFRTQKNKTYLHIDHCHMTGKIRGLLCYYCNAGLGWFQDNQSSLNEAIKYLQERNSQ